MGELEVIIGALVLIISLIIIFMVVLQQGRRAGINGAIAGLAGAMYTSFYASAQGGMGDGAEMDVIAACVIGGVSLNGGQGSAFGVLLGAITVAVIGKSLSLVGIDAFWQQALKGSIILVAVVVNVLVQRNAARKALEGREI